MRERNEMARPINDTIKSHARCRVDARVRTGHNWQSNRFIVINARR